MKCHDDRTQRERRAAGGDAAVAAAKRGNGGDRLQHPRRAYREAYGRTVCRGIQEARLREVQKLLQKTRVPIGAIGPMCGFGNEFYLKTLFKARFGMTMSEWRRTHAN